MDTFSVHPVSKYCRIVCVNLTVFSIRYRYEAIPLLQRTSSWRVFDYGFVVWCLIRAEITLTLTYLADSLVVRSLLHDMLNDIIVRCRK